MSSIEIYALIGVVVISAFLIYSAWFVGREFITVLTHRLENKGEIVFGISMLALIGGLMYYHFTHMPFLITFVN